MGNGGLREPKQRQKPKKDRGKLCVGMSSSMQTPFALVRDEEQGMLCS